MGLVHAMPIYIYANVHLKSVQCHGLQRARIAWDSSVTLSL